MGSAPLLPLLLSTARGIDVLFPTPQRCRCGTETQVFHNIEGRTACAGCEGMKEPHIGPLWNAGWTEASMFHAEKLRQHAQEVGL